MIVICKSCRNITFWDKAKMKMKREVQSQLGELSVVDLEAHDMASTSVELSAPKIHHSEGIFVDEIASELTAGQRETVNIEQNTDATLIGMIVLLNRLDKNLNMCAKRVRKSQMGKSLELGNLQNNLECAKLVEQMITKANGIIVDSSGAVAEEAEVQVTQLGANNSTVKFTTLCDRIIFLSEKRAQLLDNIRNKVNAIAPNLTALVGEVVAAKLIAHAGSLLELAKYPSSTLQIMGAEKALSRALKTTGRTPKHGHIFHAPPIAQAPSKFKGKISRVLASKMALCIRCDAFGTGSDATMGMVHRAKLETRVRELQERAVEESIQGQGNHRYK